MLDVIFKAVYLLFKMHTIKSVHGKFLKITLAYMFPYSIIFKYMFLITLVIANIKCHIISM